MTTQFNSNCDCNVLVSGDVVTDHFLYEGRQRRSGSTIRLGTVAEQIAGGAALLAALLQEVAARKPTVAPVSCVFNNKGHGASIADGYCVMRPYQQLPNGKDEVWRMAEALGFGSAVVSLDPATVDHSVLALDHKIGVIDDAGLLFRRWPTQFAWPRFLVDSSRPSPEWLVIKMSGPVATGDLWDTIVSGQTQDNPPQHVRDCAEILERTIGIISINDLRAEPIQVSGRLSWERAALDLAHELSSNASLAGLRRMRFVVVSLHLDGALIAEFPKTGEPRFQLVFDPPRLECDFATNIRGTLFGYQTCLTAAIVSQLAGTVHSEPSAAAIVESGVHIGMCAMRRLLIAGHGPVSSSPAIQRPGFPLGIVADEIVAAKHEWTFGAAKIPSGLPRSSTWTIIASGSAAPKAAPLWGLARRVALHGVRQLQQTPYLQFGKLFSIERTEIEGLRTLQHLLITYKNDLKAEKPLSIAAFGPPGSGKSFGVKQLSKAIFGDDVPLLEFNLSQFRDASELHGLLHQVRDYVLRGTLPIVFWDEFDSQNLAWLQYLLAPMQDGTFQEGQITHPVGKCVFLFAGGTRSRIEEFGSPPAVILNSGNSAKIEEWKEDFKAKKGPDFKSRLAGYINVLGPNPSINGNDITYPVRRALLLRVHLGVPASASANIDPGLLAGFLEIDEFRHGTRSLEKIAEQVRLASRTGEFTRSDLPARSQLELHVDADKFLALVER